MNIFLNIISNLQLFDVSPWVQAYLPLLFSTPLYIIYMLFTDLITLIMMFFNNIFTFFIVDLDSAEWKQIVDLLLSNKELIVDQISNKHPGYFVTGSFIVESILLIGMILFFILSMLNNREWKNPIFADSIFISGIYLNFIGLIFLITKELCWFTNYAQIAFYPTSNFYNCIEFVYIKIFVLITVIIYQIICLNYFKAEKTIVFEYTFFIITFVITMLLLISSTNLFYSFLLIETQSLILYILVALKRYSNFSVEASVKYFIFGSYASGLMLLGISLIYYFTGTVNFFELNMLMSGLLSSNYIFILYAVSILYIGIFLKIALAPFHFWIADVYEGSPTIITSFLAIVSKLPLLILLMKLIYFVFSQLSHEINAILLILGLLSVILGSTSALYQISFKKMIAYSAIAHVGYMIIALSIGTPVSLMAFCLYLIIYTINSISLFAVIINIRHLSNKSNKLYYPEFLKKIVAISILKDYSYILVFIISITIFSLAGLPPFAGFFSKLLIFLSLLDSYNKLMAFITIFISILSMVYYMRLIRFLFFHFQKDIKMPIKNRKSLTRPACYILVFIFIINILFIIFFPLILYYIYFICIKLLHLYV